MRIVPTESMMALDEEQFDAVHLNELYVYHDLVYVIT